MLVALNENDIVGSKKQFCVRIPEYLQNGSQDDIKYRTRNPKDFRRLEELALLLPVPSSQKGQHNTAVNPDIRRKFREIGKKAREMPPGNEEWLRKTVDESATERPAFGPEEKALEHIPQWSESIARETIWYVGRAIDRDEMLPYEFYKQKESSEAKDDNEASKERSYGVISYFALKSLLFGHIAPYYRPEAEPEVNLSESIGKTKQPTRYILAGEFVVDKKHLKKPKELTGEWELHDRNVESNLKYHIEVLLTMLFRLGMFDPESADQSNWRQVRVGEGEYGVDLTLNGEIGPDDVDMRPENLADARQSPYQEDIQDTLKQIAQRRTTDVNIKSDRVEFEFEYLL